MSVLKEGSYLFKAEHIETLVPQPTIIILCYFFLSYALRIKGNV